jgi:hypothetical protein
MMNDEMASNLRKIHVLLGEINHLTIEGSISVMTGKSPNRELLQEIIDKGEECLEQYGIVRGYLSQWQSSLEDASGSKTK